MAKETSIREPKTGPMETDIHNILALIDNTRSVFSKVSGGEESLRKLHDSINSKTGLLQRIVLVHKSDIPDEVWRESLKKTRQINPNVRPDAEYAICGGERRFRAFFLDPEKIPKTIPCDVKHYERYSEVLKAVDAENEEREAISTMDKIRRMARMRQVITSEEGECTLERLAAFYRVTGGYLSHLLGVLNFAKDIQDAVNEEKITTIDAYNLAKVTDKETRIKLVDLRDKKYQISAVQWSNIVSNVSKGIPLEKAKEASAKKTALDKEIKKTGDTYYDLYARSKEENAELIKEHATEIKKRDETIASLRQQVLAAQRQATTTRPKVDKEAIAAVEGDPAGCLCPICSGACKRSSLNR